MYLRYKMFREVNMNLEQCVSSMNAKPCLYCASDLNGNLITSRNVNNFLLRLIDKVKKKDIKFERCYKT